jgi:hypothetical protein
MSWVPGDVFYAWSSLVFLVAAAIGFFRPWESAPHGERTADGMCLLVFGVSILMLVAMSMRYDFGQCWYPSREHPYFTSARLISGALVPSVVLYLRGLDWLLRKTRVGINGLIVVFAIAVVSLTADTIVSLDVFGSAYNWFHLR